jgi:hypothetical protein
MRYVIRATKPLFVETPLWDEQRSGLIPEITVSDRKEVSTGLVTVRGEPICRLAPPVGFGRDREW